jgi:hypothetical protein
MAKKARLTRRLKRQYQAVLELDAHSWMYPGPGWSNKNYHKYNKNRTNWDYDPAWGAWAFAKEWQNRQDVDIKRLQRIVIKSGNPYVAYAFARDVKEANINRLQRLVIYSGDPDIMRIFANNIRGANQYLLNSLADVAEIMVAW